MVALTEQEIFNIVYALYEGDTTNWTTTSDEYLSARVYANAAINRWEQYEQTNWRELWTRLVDSSTGTKSITTGVFSYTCPTDMAKPASYVRTGDNNIWNVAPLDKVPSMVGQTDPFVYFTGNVKDGFKLNFNSALTVPTGETINYEYYKNATMFTTTTSKTEMADPYFIVYFILARFFENDGEDGRASKAFQEAEARLDAMRTNNIIHLEGVEDSIESSLNMNSGFGY